MGRVTRSAVKNGTERLFRGTLEAIAVRAKTKTKKKRKPNKKETTCLEASTSSNVVDNPITTTSSNKKISKKKTRPGSPTPNKNTPRRRKIGIGERSISLPEKAGEHEASNAPLPLPQPLLEPISEDESTTEVDIPEEGDGDEKVEEQTPQTSMAEEDGHEEKDILAKDDSFSGKVKENCTSISLLPVLVTPEESPRSSQHSESIKVEVTEEEEEEHINNTNHDSYSASAVRTPSPSRPEYQDQKLLYTTTPRNPKKLINHSLLSDVPDAVEEENMEIKQERVGIEEKEEQEEEESIVESYDLTTYEEFWNNGGGGDEDNPNPLVDYREDKKIPEWASDAESLASLLFKQLPEQDNRDPSTSNIQYIFPPPPKEPLFSEAEEQYYRDLCDQEAEEEEGNLNNPGNSTCAPPFVSTQEDDFF